MSNPPNGVSIVICTYNGRKNLSPTLEHIALQKESSSIPVELLIIDNASTDNTSEFVSEKWASLHTNIPLRIIDEPRAGKAYASRTGFSAAQFAFIIVCDDDNWLCDSYVKDAYNIMSANTDIGALGGKGVPVFEAQKPEWFDKHEILFAIGNQGKDENLWGAGMVFRKEIWDTLTALDYKFFLNEKRSGSENWGGDDTELCEMIRMLGYKICVNNTMTFKHYMPQNRMTVAYVRSARLYLQAYLYCRTHNNIPGEHLKYPLWLDKWVHKTKDYLKQLPKYIFYKGEKLDDDHLKFLALKGEIAELWRIKSKYNDVFTYIFEMQKKIAALKKA
jgi:glycosyltransferase involved in cell wall biosynthesis